MIDSKIFKVVYKIIILIISVLRTSIANIIYTICIKHVTEEIAIVKAIPAPVDMIEYTVSWKP